MMFLILFLAMIILMPIAVLVAVWYDYKSGHSDKLWWEKKDTEKEVKKRKRANRIKKQDRVL